MTRISGALAVLWLSAAAAQTEPEPTPPPPPATPLPVPDAQRDQPTSPAAQQASAPATFSRVIFKDGQALRGHVVSEDATEVVLELSGGGRLFIPKSMVRAVEPEAGMVTTDPNNTRYFYSPSAMMLKKGQAYFSQKELVFSSVGYGITDHFSVLAGAVVPAWFFGLSGLNGIVGLKAGAPVTEKLSVAAGLETLVLPGLGGGPQLTVAGLLFGTATYGDANRHFSIAVGKPFILTGNADLSSALIFTLSGNLRVHANAALMTENWVVIPALTGPLAGNFAVLDAVGVRVMGEKVAADLGFIWPWSNDGLLTNGVPIPWVDFTYNFNL